MSFSYQKISAAIIALAFFAPSVRADGNGQEDLDKATEAKLSATTLTDWGEVIRLAESALEKGLDKPNTEFANKLLAATLVQRAAVVAATIEKMSPADPRWPNFRQFALSDLEKSIKLEPKQPQALILIAKLNLLPEGDEKRAKEAVNQALEFSGDDPHLRSEALVLRAGTEKNPEKSLPDLNEAVQLAPNDPNVFLARSVVLAGLEKYDEALTDLNKVIDLQPENVRAYEKKYLILAHLKKYDEALAVLDKVQKLAPNSSEPWLKKMQIHHEQKKFDDAMEDMNKAIVRDPSNGSLLKLRSLLYLEKGDKEKAAADARDAVQLNPKDVSAIRNYAAILLDAGKDDEALAQLDNARKIEPDNSDIALQRSLIYLKRKQPDKAIQVYNDYLKEHPDSVTGIRNYATILVDAGKDDEALVQLEHAQKIEPDNSDIALQRCLIYLKQKQPDKAIEICKDYLKEHPDSLAGIRNYATILAYAGNNDDALAQLEKARKLEPDNPEIVLQTGAILVRQKKSDKAAEVYSDYLKDHPDSAAFLYARGDAYLNVGRQAEAEADYDKAVKDKDLSKDSGLLNNFAWVLATSPDEKLRDGKRAVKMATEACELTDYKQGHILSTLAAAYAETGDFQSAIKWSEKSAEVGPAEHAEDFKKELATYKAHNPYREVLSEEPGGKSEEKKAAPQEKPSAEEKPAVEKPAQQPAETPSPPQEKPAKTEEKPAKAAEPAREIIEPFNGKNLEGWILKQPRERSKWTVGAAHIDPQNPQGLIVSMPGDQPGELINREAPSVDIYTVVKFGDCLIDLEFMIPKDSNSGVYIMGEYEIQIVDSFGKKEMTPSDLGAIYEASAPKLNAAKAPGQWQSLAVEFQAPRFENGEKTANARFIKVTLNGQTIQENVEMKGPTPGGLSGKEAAEGPLMFQGDHGPVAFRNIKITLPDRKKE